jgi:ketosteroid isomerase-like protein
MIFCGSALRKVLLKSDREDGPMRSKEVLLGFGIALGGRALLSKAVLAKFRRDVKRLNEGDYHPVLSAYSDHAVLHFNEGQHRWSGDWHGRSEIGRFLQNFTGAHIQGEIEALAISGPPWAATLWARFNDHADAPDGTRIYDNQDVLVVRTRWGKIVEQQDFYVDSDRIVAFERALGEHEISTV